MCFLEVSTLQGPEMQMDVSALQRSVLLLEVSTLQGRELQMGASALQRSVLSWRCLHYRGLSCIWTCLHYREVYCSWRCLPQGLSYTSGRVCTAEECAASGGVYIMGA